MTNTRFNMLAAAANLCASASRVAARHVLVDGWTITDAAKDVHINKGGLSRYLSRFPKALCSKCGSPVRTDKEA